ncbi:DHA3 family macrolide efflux protein-like MFS transporter [Roseateles asaccharophilus]|uniref:MFS transporter n=1 Tax=Roseateles asaccharophilus TaxID=582607 RepID=UPI003837750B
MHRDFWCLFQGQLLSHLGTQAFQVMAMYWLAQQTGSPTAGAAFLALGLLPPVLLGPWLAKLSGKFAPRSILVWCDTASAALAAPLALAMWLGAPGTTLVALLLVTVTLLSTVNAVLTPNLQATMPLLVEKPKLPQANGWILTTQQLAAVLGQGLGGMLYAITGPAALSAMTAVGFGASALWARGMRSAPVTQAASLQSKPKPVFSMLKTHKGLRRLTIASAVFNLLYAPWLVLLPFHLAPGGGLRPETFGLALASYGAGNLLGALVVKPLLQRVRGTLIGYGLVGQALVLMALGLSTNVVAICVVLVVMGCGVSLVAVQMLTRAQTCVPQADLAPALAVIRATAHIATPFGFGFAALSRSALGLSTGTVYLVLGGALLVSMLMLMSGLDSKVEEDDDSVSQQPAA